MAALCKDIATNKSLASSPRILASFPLAQPDQVQLPPARPTAVPDFNKIVAPESLVSEPVTPVGSTTSPTVPSGVSKLNAVIPPLPSAVRSTLKLPTVVCMPADTVVKSPTFGDIFHFWPPAAMILMPAM